MVHVIEWTPPVFNIINVFLIVLRSLVRCHFNCQSLSFFLAVDVSCRKIFVHAKTRLGTSVSIVPVFNNMCVVCWKCKTVSCKKFCLWSGERGGSVVECRTPEREVRGSRPTAAVLCPWARHFTPGKYWLITQEAMAPSRHDWKIVDLDVKPQHNQPTVYEVGDFTKAL